METLMNRIVAVLTENGFEEVELTSPRDALVAAGATVDIVSPQKFSVKAMKNHDWSIEIPVDKHISEVKADDYDALLLPGGVFNPDQLRLSDEAVKFVRDFFEQGKPVAAICHGPQTLITAGVVNDRKLTSYPSIAVDLINAGADWEDAQVVVDQGLVTSRTPADLPAFNAKMIEEFAEGVHKGQHA